MERSNEGSKVNKVINEKVKLHSMNNQSTKKVYVGILCDTLDKKLKVLNQIKIITKEQEEILSQDVFQIEQFDSTIEKKDEQIKALTLLDQGFEMIYENVQNELQGRKELYKDEIKQLQNYITQIIDLNMELQAMEKRNKNRIETVLSKKRKQIANARISNQSVANYYKNISNEYQEKSFFYDKKN